MLTLSIKDKKMSALGGRPDKNTRNVIFYDSPKKKINLGNEKAAC